MRILTECKNCRAQYDVTGKSPGESLLCRCGARVLVTSPRAGESRVVRCASCGASRGQAGAVCDFCGARFTAADKGWGSMCPSCYCRLPDDAHFCVECGIKIAPIAVVAEPSNYQCPRCACALSLRTINPIKIQECPACAGIWLDVDTFESICKQRETQVAAMQGLAGKHTRLKFELDENEHVKYVPCPVCKNLMNRKNFATISGVIIDTCKSHGVWLDYRELNQIVRFIESGGLEKSRERAAQEAAHSASMNKFNTAAAALSGPPPFVMLPADSTQEFGILINVAGVLADIFLGRK